MPAAKIAVTVDKKIVKQIDRLVREGKYKSRSSVIQEALEEKLKSKKRKRLAEELARLDPEEERELADEFLQPDSGEWDEY
ncbi:hypothetical protein MNBD_NITROSPINAE03-487 [hydrothermal vent metagenome]|uniref:Ribbon-helix-helix protein CopG domain-containing protein n=1 Tax=hydrothermal vent metagenome TaxID=652676 RepID=A0A3B1BPN8_9ZZZZ